ncbi:MAG: hypothetical protein WD638_08140 [Nitriliruptoraceae bacterium]
MPPSEAVRGWSRLVASVTDTVVVTAVQDMHAAISDGAYRWVGPLGRPFQRYTDAAADHGYRAVRVAVRGVGEVAANALESVDPGDGILSPGARKARAIVRGVVPADLLARAPGFDVDLTIRRDGAEVVLSSSGLAAAYPDATGRLTVFVHGLVDSEDVWTPRRGGEVSLPRQTRLAGSTPVMVRYGTGRAIAESGADLAHALEALVANWPEPVTHLTLIGHSMGGLVIRAAQLTADHDHHVWPDMLSDVVYLATPHLGSWLEKVANVTSWTLRRMSRTAPIGALLDNRPRGIKDLRFGALAEDAWTDQELDGLLTGRTSPPLAWDDRVGHHLVVGRLRSERNHLLNRVFGDALVREGSAAGSGRWRRVPGPGHLDVVELPLHHTGMARAPAVAEVLARVLASEPQGRA